MTEPASTRRLRNACVILLCGGLLSGCAAVVAGTAGGLIVDEGMN